MGEIVIKKQVDLDFLGNDYKNAYLIFRSIPLAKLDEVQKAMPKNEEEAKKVNANSVILDQLKKFFVAGKFPGENGELEDLTAEDLNGLDAQAAVRCFQVWTGQDIDPKEEAPLMTQSSTNSNPQ